MEEELSKKISSFVLTNEEDEAVEILAADFKASKQDCLLSVVGKIITQKGINLSGLKVAMDAVWGYPRGFKVMEVGGGVYQFVFGKEMDLLRVLTGSPWLYNNQLIVLQRWTEGIKPEEILFSYSPFWIQLRALPLEFMSIDVGKRMMAGFGDVEEVNIAQLSGNQGRCIRVKVELNIIKPLPRGKKVYTADWKPIWVPFRYEKLPILCHYCGVVGNDDRMCVTKNQETKDGTVKENQYGGWMKASPVKLPPRRRTEGRPDFFSAESSPERSSYGKPEDHGKDIVDTRNSGDSERGKRRLQWESNEEAGGNGLLEVGHLGGSPTNCELHKSNKGDGPMPEPTSLLAGSHVMSNATAQLDGFLVSPSQLMEVDPQLKPVGALNDGDKSPSLVQEFSGEEMGGATKKPQQNDKGNTRSGKNTVGRGYKRKIRASVMPSVDAEQMLKRGGSVPCKRKNDEDGVVEQSDEGITLNQLKRQKLGISLDKVTNFVEVEEASPNWPQGAR